MAQNYGIKAINPESGSSLPHIFGFSTARTVADDILVDVWNAATSAGRVAKLDKDGRWIIGDGTVAKPAFSFTGDADCGLYRIGANNIGLAVNGAKVLDIGTAGLGVTGTLTSSGLLTVSAGGAAITGNSTVTGTLTATAGLTVSAGGAAITGNSTVTGTLNATSTLTAQSGFVVSAGGAAITGNSTVTGTLNATSTLTAQSGFLVSAGTVTITPAATITGGVTSGAGYLSGTGLTLKGSAPNPADFDLRYQINSATTVLSGGYYVDSITGMDPAQSAQGFEVYLTTSHATGAVPLAIGQVAHQENTGAGTITEARAFSVGAGSSGAGTITTLKHLNIEAGWSTGGATITTAYGLYVTQVGIGSTKYAIYADASLACDYGTNPVLGADATRLLVWDIDAGSLVRVTRGGADSGGSGYRLLRIPN